MISIRDLRVGFGQSDVLHGVSIEVKRGGITALVGANGAGKTTLLRAISRLLPLRGGSIVFDGEPIEALEPHAVAQIGLVQVPQGRMIIPGLTVDENLMIGANRIAARDPSQREAMREAEFRRFPMLKERRHIDAGALSGGEQQMLALSRALMMRPKLLMLDEPSLGLAPQIVAAILAALRELASAGMTVLLVEQAAFQALKIADYGYVLQNGSVALAGDTATMLADPQLIERYLG